MTSPRPSPFEGEGDTSSRTDAFSRAILDEKDPVIRGYMENLRSQIAAIAAAHGANARDVWDRAVQDRMSVDEMERVNALFARIKAMAEKKVSSVDARKMEEELSEREATARAMFREAVDGIAGKAYGFDEVFQMCVRAGMRSEALGLFERYPTRFSGANDGAEFQVSLGRLRAEEAAANGFPERVPAILWRAVENAINQRRFQTLGLRTHLMRDRLFVETFGAYLSSLTDETVKLRCADTLSKYYEYGRLAVARLGIEVRKRGLDRIESVRTSLERQVEDACCDQELKSPFVRAAEFLALAEAAHAAGADPTEYLDLASARFKESLEIAVDEYGDPIGSLPNDFIRTLARVGQTGRMQELMGPACGAEFEAFTWYPTYEGLIDAGDYERARSLLDLAGELGWNNYHPLLLVGRLIKAGQVSLAERTYDEYGIHDPDIQLEIALGKQADRARRGEDVLSEARQGLGTALERDDRTGPPRYLVLANAAIATIGYTVEIKKRIVEYASKR